MDGEPCSNLNACGNQGLLERWRAAVQVLLTSPKKESLHAGCRPLLGVGARSREPGRLHTASSSALYCSLLAWMRQLPQGSTCTCTAAASAPTHGPCSITQLAKLPGRQGRAAADVQAGAYLPSHLASPGHELQELVAPVQADHAHVLLQAWQRLDAPLGPCKTSRFWTHTCVLLQLAAFTRT